MMLFAFVALLAVHWIADFVCQTHWQASNKSKDNVALLRHVLTYTGVLAICSMVLFMGAVSSVQIGAFVALNAVLHFATDWLTSRWSSRYFEKAFRDGAICFQYQRVYKHAPSRDEMRKLDIDPDANHWHNFFVVIGFDQLIHQVTLAATFYLIIGGF